jgi:hypothetical protein
MQYVFKCYLDTFTAVQCGFLVSCGRCPNGKLFLSKSYKSCPYLWSQKLLLSVPAVHPNTQEEANQKFCLEPIPIQKRPKVLNQAIVVAKLSFPPRQIQATTNNTVRAPHRYMAPWRLAGFLSSPALIECHLAVWIKTCRLGATFEAWLTKLFRSYDSRFLYN